MADQSDVEAALVSFAAAALYPAGAMALSLTGKPLRVYRGWPSNTALEADIAAGICHITVFPAEAAQTQTTRYLQSWENAAAVIPALEVSYGVDSVEFSGTASPGQVAGVLADNAAFAYRTKPGDTPATVASALATLVATVRPATLSGSTVQIPRTTRLIGRVEADQTSLLQTRRQRQLFRITVWCPDPAMRDTVAAAVDGAFAATAFLTFNDTSMGHLQFVSSQNLDELEPAVLYRRDLTYSMEYPTTQLAVQPSMMFGGFAVAGMVSETLS